MSKHILTILLLNITAFCIFSIFSEYFSVADKIASVDSAMAMSIDSAVQLTLSSEELFGNDWRSNLVTSRVDEVSSGEVSGDTIQGTSDFRGIFVPYYNGSSWVTSELYNLSNGLDPDDNTFSASHDIESPEDVYNFLYNEGGFFSAFYSNVGKKLTTSTYEKVTSAESYAMDIFDLTRVSRPVLDKMGLSKATNNSDNSILFTGEKKVGKSLVQDSSDSFSYSDDNLPEQTSERSSEYFLTPTSLGVTYLDPRVLKTLVVAHLQNAIRCQRGSDEGCLGIVKTYPFDPISNQRYKPAISERNIFNNGLVEFDFDSLDVNISYGVVDTYDSNSDALVGYLYGVEPGKTSADGTANRLKGDDTSSDKNGKRIVAKIDVGVDINIPYTTLPMQYARYISKSDNKDRLGIRPTDNNRGKDNPSLIRYNYTTYASIGR